jgi:hypothetical protein
MEAIPSPKTFNFHLTGECNILENININIENWVADLEILFICVLNVSFYLIMSVE